MTASACLIVDSPDQFTTAILQHFQGEVMFEHPFRIRQSLVAAAFCLFTVVGNAAPSLEQLALGKELAEVLQVRAMFNTYLKECTSTSSQVFSAKFAFDQSPGSFGGLTPQSAYWPEVEATYQQFQIATCSYISAEKFLMFYGEELAARNTEEDLRAAIAFNSSPAGRRLQASVLATNDVFQKYAQEQMAAAYAAANAPFQAAISALIRKYRREPR